MWNKLPYKCHNPHSAVDYKNATSMVSVTTVTYVLTTIIDFRLFLFYAQSAIWSSLKQLQLYQTTFSVASLLRLYCWSETAHISSQCFYGSFSVIHVLIWVDFQILIHLKELATNDYTQSWSEIYFQSKLWKRQFWTCALIVSWKRGQ